MARKTSSGSSFFANLYDKTQAKVRGVTGAGAGGPDTLSLVAIGACVLLGVVALIVGVPRLRGYLSQRSFVAASEVTLRFDNPPSWLDPTRAEELRRLVASAVGDGSAVDPARLVTAKDALMSSGWFKSVRQVSLDANGGFVADAQFRVPFALVLHGSREHLVDIDGCRLPAEWELGTRPSKPHWVTIVNTEQGPPGEPGAHWNGADLAAALELVKLTFDRPWESHVAAIDVAKFRGDGLMIQTAKGGFVLWGLPPSVTSAIEPPADAKLRNLDVLFARTGFIDSGGGRVIDLRTDMPSARVVAEDTGGGDERAKH